MRSKRTYAERRAALLKGVKFYRSLGCGMGVINSWRIAMADLRKQYYRKVM